MEYETETVYTHIYIHTDIYIYTHMHTVMAYRDYVMGAKLNNYRHWFVDSLHNYGIGHSQKDLHRIWVIA